MARATRRTSKRRAPKGRDEAGTARRAGAAAWRGFIAADRAVIAGIVSGARTLVGFGATAGRHDATRRGILSACVLIAFGIASLSVRGVVQGWPELRPGQVRLELGELPPWLSERATADLGGVLGRAGAQGEPASLWDPERVPRVAVAIRTLPWVKSLDEVRADWPAAVRLRLRVRRPALVVPFAGRDFLLDETGHPLPGDRYRWSVPGDVGPDASGDEADSAALALPRVVGSPGAAFGPGRGQGTSVRERALEHVLTVSRELREVGLLDRLRLAEIDIGNLDGVGVPGESEVVLVTERGVRIEWGRASCCAELGRPTAAKIADLEAVLARSPALEGIARLSLRWDEPVFVPAAPVETAEGAEAGDEHASASRPDGGRG